MSNDSNATTTGQAPATDATQNGQAPTATTITSTQQTPTDDWKPPTREEHERLLREREDLRKEAAGYRVKAKTLDERIAAEEAAKLTETEKAAKRAQEAEATAAKYRERIVAGEVKLHAQSLGFVDPADALSFLDRDKLKLDDDGLPTNAEELLKALAERKPYLLKAQQQAPAEQQQAAAQQRPAPPSAGAAMNPARSQHQGVQTPLTVQQARQVRLGTGVYNQRPQQGNNQQP